MFWLIFFVSLLSASVIGQDSEPQDILEIGSKRHHHPSLDFCVRQSIESIITKTSSERLRSWLSCVRQINRPKAEGLGEGDEENEKEFRHNKTRTKIGYWRARKNLSASVRSVDISEVKSYGPMEEDDLFGFGASGTAEPVPNMNDVVDGVTRGLQDVEKTDITFVACWTDTPYGQLNNFLVSTIHALLAAHDAGRTLAVLDRIPCNSADGFALADLLDISALHAVMGTRSITIFPCALYAETCADAEKVRTLGPFERFMDVFTTYPEVDNITIKLMSCKGRWPETTYPKVDKIIAKSTSQEGRETGTKRDREKEIYWHVKHSNYTLVLDSDDEDDTDLVDLYHSSSKFRKFVDDAGAAKRNGQA